VRIRCSAGGKLFFSRDLGMTTLRNLTLGSTGKGSWLVNVTAFSTIDLDGVWFEAAPEGIHIFVCQGFLVVQNDYRILGGASRHLSASDNGVAYYGGFTVEVPQPVSFDDFAVAEAGALITAGGVPMKFTGDGLANSTGRKFHVASNGVLLGAGTEFPGDKPGIGMETVLETTIAAEKRSMAEKDLLLAQKDTLLARQEALLAERDSTLAEQRQLLAERDAALAEQKLLVAERDGMLAEQKQFVAERDAALAEQKLLVAERDGMLAEQKQFVAERDAALAEQKLRLAERDDILRLRQAQLANYEATLSAIRNSRSWRLTAPLRKAASRLRK
jgi:hypothetical protein